MDHVRLPFLLLKITVGYDYRVCDECKKSTQYAYMKNCVKKKAFIFDPNRIIHEQATFYMDTFAPMALRKLKQKWDIQSIYLARRAFCSYRHLGLCKYANILTYLFPETRTSAKAFAKKVVSVLEHVYMIKGRLRESRSDAVDGPTGLGVPGKGLGLSKPKEYGGYSRSSLRTSSATPSRTWSKRGARLSE